MNKYDLVNSVWAVRMALHDVRPANSHSNKNLNRAHKLLRALIATYGTESGEEREEIDNEDTSLESIMKCSKEAIARAYMCRAYVTVPIGKCPDLYCRVRGCKTTYNGKKYICKMDNCVWSPDTYPQAWEEVLNSEREKRGCLSPRS